MERRTRVLVTGGAGFIGSNLVRACLDAGEQVRVLDDLSTGRLENLADLGPELELVEGSLVDLDTVRRATRDCQVVYHLGARPSVVESIEDPLQTHAVNLEGTLHVLEAARQEQVRRVVFASSCAIYGDSQKLPLGEDQTPAPLSPYALHKLVGELYCQQFTRLYGLETVALRFFNVFGPRQPAASGYAAVVPLFMRALLGGESPAVYGDGLQSRDFVYVSDVVAATRAAAGAPSDSVGQTINVGRGESATILELLEHLRSSAEPEGPETRFEPARPGEVRHSRADIGKAERLLGWTPRVGLEEGLGKALRAFAEEKAK